jgi:DtxR family Mn-dependent transcriptional regulator
MDEQDLTQSLEDYLEVILILERKNRVARVKDIASSLQVQMSSVTRALKNLRSRGLINYEKNSFISLTEEGSRIASGVERKHELLVDFLANILLVPMDIAQVEACTMEHGISLNTANRIKKLSAYIKGSLLDNGKITLPEWNQVIA